MYKDWKCTALTDIWTGDVHRKPSRLIPSGIVGSLRWWYEVLVRGLGGKACDPTADGVRCPDQSVNEPDKPGHHCVVCELFGCTGWARKFRLMILDENGQVIQNQIEAKKVFILRFIPLRPITPEEWCLLDATLRLIAEYGAIGGKTVFKPSDEQNRQNQLHHRDFGLVAITQRPEGVGCERNIAEKYVCDSRWRRSFQDKVFSWASLKNFWCVKGRYLARQNSNQSSFNIGRHKGKNQSQQLSSNTNVDRWLAGRQQESKKVFSFKHPEEARRTFGFVKPELVDFTVMESRLKTVWPNFPDKEFQIGDQILNELFK